MAVDIKTLKTLGVSSITGKLPSGVPSDYSLDNVATAFSAELAKKFPYTTYHQFQIQAPHIYDLLQSVYSEVLPREVLSSFGSFAEVKTIGHSQKETFTKTLGKERGKAYVTNVGLGGRFETFRLDRTEFEIPTFAIGGAAILDWERLLANQESLSEYLQVLMQGFQDRIFESIAGALYSSLTAIRPNINAFTGATFDESQFSKMLNAVSYYSNGRPTILATRAFIDTMPVNAAFATKGGTTVGRVSDKDVDDLRTLGLITMYKGCQVIELPQSFKNETNTETVLDDSYCFIVPGDRKIARLVFEGDLQFRQFENRDFSIELAAYQKIGTAILHYNNWAIYRNTSLV